jgi:hypothetical protein
VRPNGVDERRNGRARAAGGGGTVKDQRFDRLGVGEALDLKM